jgi:hypothetical protein
MTRKRSSYRPSLKRVPVMKELHDQIAMGLHTAYGVLERAPDATAVDQLSEGIGMVGFAAEGDARFVDEMLQINSGMRSLEQIGGKSGELTTTALELLPVRNAVLAVDAILPRMDGAKLIVALTRLRALATQK